MPQSDPIFLSAAAVARGLGSDAGWLAAWCDLYAAGCAALAEPGHEEFHLWPFMPPPAYEETVALVLPEGAVWPASFGAAGDWLLVLALPEGARTRLRLGGTGLDLARDTAGITATFDGRTAEFSGDEAQVSLRPAAGRLHLAVNGRLVGALPAGAEPPRPEIHARTGETLLIMAQSLAPVPDVLVFDAVLAPDHRRIPRERNAYRFAWGLRSLRIAGLTLMAALLADLRAGLDAGAATVAPDLAARVAALDDGQRDLLGGLLDALAGWPRWRPAAGAHPAAGPWDRNSFTNGSLALAVACLGRLLPGRLPAAALRQTIARKAGAFFAAETELAFARTLRSRPAGWWMRRSANHGLIMMLTYATAMRLTGSQHDPVARLVEENALAAIETLYADGSFCEGVHYNAFALTHLIPWLALAGTGPDSPGAGALARMPGLYDWWSLSLDGRGGVFANFGDNFGTEVAASRISLVDFLRSFARADLAEGVGRGGVDVFTPLVAGLPAPAPAAPGLVLRCYPRNRFALAAAIGADARRGAGLFVIGSKLQATHNRNHDCAGFAFHGRDLEVAIAGSSRQPHRNNAVGLLDQGRILPFAGERDYSGEIEASELPGGIALIRAGYAAEVPLAGLGPRQIRVERDFVFAPGAAVELLIRTRIKGAKGLVPFLAFDLRPPAPAGMPAEPPPGALATVLAGGDGPVPLVPVLRKGLTCFDAGDPKSRPVVFLSWIGGPGADPAGLIALLPEAG